MDIAFGAFGSGIVRDDGLAEAGCFREADAPGDDGLEDLGAEKFLEIAGDLTGEVGAVVKHREEDTFEGEGVPKGGADSIDRIHELGYALEGEKLALDWDQNRVGSNEGVESQEVEGGRAVDEGEIVRAEERPNTVSEPEFAVRKVDKLKVGANEVLVGGDDVKAFEIGLGHGMAGFGVTKEDVIETGALESLGHTQAGSGIALRVRIDDQDS